MESPFAPTAKMEPYWWEDAPRPVLPDPALPQRTDVVVIGCGYTGVSAALTLARGGRETVVFDAEHAGWGCSTRNGGQIHMNLRLTLGQLAANHERSKAVALVRETINARNYIEDLIRREGIECNWKVCGRFVGAHRPGDYEALAAELPEYKSEFGIDADMVPRSEQRSELGTDAYYGGQLVPNNASLHPALFHAGMLDRAIKAGAMISIHNPVAKVERDGDAFVVTHGRGTIRAKNVIVATNGYTDSVASLAPDLRRRVIPIGSYVIATEPMSPNLMNVLMPKKRIVIDTRRVVYYYRASPDGQRIVFGGRVASTETNPEVSGSRLHAVMAGLFPETRDVKISHSWMGFVAYTFDHVPHLGTHDGIHYAMGYCGSGAHMAPYLGHKIAQKVLGKTVEGATAFDDLKFQARPFYSGAPWFLAGMVMFYRFMDRLPRAFGRLP